MVGLALIAEEAVVSAFVELERIALAQPAELRVDLLDLIDGDEGVAVAEKQLQRALDGVGLTEMTDDASSVERRGGRDVVGEWERTDISASQLAFTRRCLPVCVQVNLPWHWLRSAVCSWRSILSTKLSLA